MPIGCTETSFINHQSTLRETVNERRFHLCGSESLKSHTNVKYLEMYCVAVCLHTHTALLNYKETEDDPTWRMTVIFLSYRTNAERQPRSHNDRLLSIPSQRITPHSPHLVTRSRPTPRHEGAWGNGGIAPHVLNLGIWWHQWIVSWPGHFIPRKQPGYPLNTRLDVHQGRSRRCGGKKSPASAENRTAIPLYYTL